MKPNHPSDLLLLPAAWLLLNLAAPVFPSRAANPPPSERSIDLATQDLGDGVVFLAPDDGGPALRVQNDTAKPGTWLLFEISSPAVETDAYAVKGDVRYQGVKGDAFLEMWSHLPAVKGETQIAASFFSRTLETGGLLGKLTGDSDWRPFHLPAIVNDGSGRRPLKLTLNLVLPDAGTVEVRNLRLAALPAPAGLLARPGTRLALLLAAMGVGLGITFTLLALHVRKKRTENELRRIRAADT
ncbi:MAG: hypothetical protein H7A53_04185 [Akkermansiaceae bacterium]|nr:hypothetical protein [Akkermansiaceae bacterium]MCP5550073.1 hypothetical protein [Akkermansiaceae bacterium]